jgi:hypothetical protein
MTNSELTIADEFKALPQKAATKGGFALSASEDCFAEISCQCHVSFSLR